MEIENPLETMDRIVIFVLGLAIGVTLVACLFEGWKCYEI